MTDLIEAEQMLADKIGQALVLKQGDTLVIGITGSNSTAQFEQTSNQIKDVFQPRGIDVIVMDHVQALAVIRK
jgi:hypothetical protein